MTMPIVFHCAKCTQTETLSLEEFRLTGYPLCPHHQTRMQPGKPDAGSLHPDDEISQAVNEAMRAITRLTVVALRGGKSVSSTRSSRE